MPRTAPRPTIASRVLIPLGVLIPLVACSTTKEVDEDRQLEIYVEMANGYYKLGELERAKDQAMKGLELDRDNTELLLILGKSMQRTGTREEIGGAEEIFRDLISDDDYRGHYGLAVALERKGQFFEEAAREIESGERYTDATDIAERAAMHRESAEDAWHESIEHYTYVVGLDPENRDALNGLQRVHSLLDQPDEALAWAQRLLETADSQLVFWRNQLERPEISASDEENFRFREQDLVNLTVATRLNAYALLMRLGRKTEALAHLDAVIELDNTKAAVFSRRAQLLAELGEYERAIADLDEFLRNSELAYDHPDIQRVYNLRTTCEMNLRKAMTASAPK